MAKKALSEDVESAVYDQVAING
ncbi:hypothetical protein PMI17_03288, partial [Pantoea sp. GM01]